MKNTVIFKLANIYYIVVSIYVIFYYTLSFFSSFKTLPVKLIVFDLIIIFLFLFLLVTNYLLLRNKDLILFLFDFNIYFSLFQIINIQLPYFKYNFTSGIEFEPFIALYKNLEFGLGVKLIRTIFDFNIYQGIEGFYIGLNIIPIVLFFIYKKAKNKIILKKV